MYEDINDRVLKFARYIVDNNATIRDCAKHFDIAKSTVHHDLQLKLKGIDRELYEEVRKILYIHFIEKHLKGGEATRQKYLQERELHN